MWKLPVDAHYRFYGNRVSGTIFVESFMAICSRRVHVEPNGTISKAVVLQKFAIWSLMKKYFMNFSVKYCFHPAPLLQKI